MVSSFTRFLRGGSSILTYRRRLGVVLIAFPDNVQWHVMRILRITATALCGIPTRFQDHPLV